MVTTATIVSLPLLKYLNAMGTLVFSYSEQFRPFIVFHAGLMHVRRIVRAMWVHMVHIRCKCNTLGSRHVHTLWAHLPSAAPMLQIEICALILG